VSLETWTNIEDTLLRSPEFKRSYVARTAGPISGNWLARFAAQVGAERVFAHALPGRYYLLAAFRRRNQPSADF
jgi:hypothetical protein